MNKRRNISHTQGGYVLIINILIFFAVAFLIISALFAPLMSSSRTSKNGVAAAQAFMLASSATEEALYKLKRQMMLGANETLVLGDATAEIAVSSGSNETTVQIDATAENVVRSLQLVTSKGAGVSFNYGMQVGRGGFSMSGGSQVQGNVYANGDIVGNGDPVITGSAISANRSNPVADQANTGPDTPAYAVDFGGNATPQDLAASFLVSTSSPVTSVQLYMKKSTTNWMNDITLRIATSPAAPDEPEPPVLASVTIPASAVTTSYTMVTVTLPDPLVLTPDKPYWFVLDTGTTWGAHYSLAATPNNYTPGLMKVGTWNNGNGGSWSASTPAWLDPHFAVFVGGDTGKISGVTVGQSGGDAWAHEVVNTTVSGSLYCQGGSGNNKPCDTSRPDPAQQPMPITDGNIEDWKDEAAVGGIYQGSLHYGDDDVDSIGPMKIEGDLSVTNGARLNITGTLWVTGDILLSGDGRIRLAGSYGDNPGTIVSDGTVDLTAGGQFEGNSSGGYLLTVTTSSCPDGCGSTPAIDVGGGTGAVVLNAQNGTIRFSGGATAKQATAKHIEMTGGAILQYEDGLADVNFSSGPSGSWTIDAWDEI